MHTHIINIIYKNLIVTFILLSSNLYISISKPFLTSSSNSPNSASNC